MKQLKNCAGISIFPSMFMGIGGVPVLAPAWSQCKHLDVQCLTCKLDKDNRLCNSITGYKKKLKFIPSYKCDYREMMIGVEALKRYELLEDLKNKL